MLRKLTLVAAVVPLLASCQDATAPNGTSQLTVMITDAGGDFLSAMVTIDAVYLQGSDGADGGGRVYLSETPMTTDLLTLSNDAATLVDGAVVPSGTYSELRFVISGAYVEVDNGDNTSSFYATQGYDEHLPVGETADGLLQMPSYAASGLKVKFDGALDVTGAQEVLLVDFNVAQSFGRQAGSSGSWVMDPVVRGASMDLTSSVTVTLAMADGVTLPEVGGSQVGLGDFKAVLSDGGSDVKEAAFVDVDGVYTAAFPYLMPATDWSLEISGPTGLTFTTDPTLPMDVSTSSGQDQRFDLKIASAEATGP